MIEKTLVVLKPDAVARRLCGKIIDVFEEAQLSIIAAKMLTPSASLVDRHYPKDKAYLTSLGHKSAVSYAADGKDVKKKYGTSDEFEIGKNIRAGLIKYISSGPVLALCLQGSGAIKAVRKLVGFTLPYDAAPGTIRGRFSIDSADSADSENRPIHNLVHASGNPKEARAELKLWFGKV
jgi:nucleoside-diphosphate kinase